MFSERYARQLLLIKEKDQKKLARSNILVMGLGAIGSRTSELLARSGVNNLTIVDRDFVEVQNIQSQIYTENDIGKAKARALKKHLQAINSEAMINAVVEHIDQGNVSAFNDYDIILDCTDNMETRFLINDHCMEINIPWIYCAVLGTKGVTMNIVPQKTPCFRCLFPKNIRPGSLETCETAGLINTVACLASSLQVTECIKILLGKDFSQDLVYFDVWEQTLDKIKVRKRDGCKVCGGVYEFLEKKPESVVRICSGTYQVKPDKPVNFSQVKSRLEGAKISHGLLHYSSSGYEISLFKDGRAIIKGAKTKEQARSVYSRFVGD
jgi:adenylyltransferase/sulfurtransferase